MLGNILLRQQKKLLLHITKRYVPMSVCMF